MKYFNLKPFLGIVAIIAILTTSVGYYGMHALAASGRQHANSCTTNCVLVSAQGFSKTEMAVTVGSYVEFRANDSQSHNLALGSGTDHSQAQHDESHTTTSAAPAAHDHVEGTESGDFSTGEMWKVQFKHVGTYIIHDHYFPNNTILVVVYAPTTAAK